MSPPVRKLSLASVPALAVPANRWLLTALAGRTSAYFTGRTGSGTCGSPPHPIQKPNARAVIPAGSSFTL